MLYMLEKGETLPAIFSMMGLLAAAEEFTVHFRIVYRASRFRKVEVGAPVCWTNARQSVALHCLVTRRGRSESRRRPSCAASHGRTLYLRTV